MDYMEETCMEETVAELRAELWAVMENKRDLLASLRNANDRIRDLVDGEEKRDQRIDELESKLGAANLDLIIQRERGDATLERLLDAEERNGVLEAENSELRNAISTLARIINR